MHHRAPNLVCVCVCVCVRACVCVCARAGACLNTGAKHKTHQRSRSQHRLPARTHARLKRCTRAQTYHYTTCLPHGPKWRGGWDGAGQSLSPPLPPPTWVRPPSFPYVLHPSRLLHALTPLLSALNLLAAFRIEIALGAAVIQVEVVWISSARRQRVAHDEHVAKGALYVERHNSGGLHARAVSGTIAQMCTEPLHTRRGSRIGLRRRIFSSGRHHHQHRHPRQHQHFA